MNECACARAKDNAAATTYTYAICGCVVFHTRPGVMKASTKGVCLHELHHTLEPNHVCLLLIVAFY